MHSADQRIKPVLPTTYQLATARGAATQMGVLGKIIIHDFFFKKMYIYTLEMGLLSSFEQQSTVFVQSATLIVCVCVCVCVFSCMSR